MKKNNIRIITAAAGILLLAGCSNDGGGISVDADAGSITIDATIGRMTKVSADGTNFTAGDAIALYAWTGDAASVPATRVVDSVVNSFDGTVWTPAKQMNWKNATDAHYFLGIYPVPDSVTSFTAAAYKLNPAEYESSDLLIATNLGGVTVADGPVNLTFEHAMAKLNVNLKFRSEFSANTTVSSVTATAYDSATVNYLTKNMTVAGSTREVLIPQTSTPATDYNVSFSGLQVPQDGVKKITVTIDGRTFVYDASQDIPLDAGKYTTIGLIVGNDKMVLDDISISNWTADADLGCQEAVLQDPYNGHEYVDLGLLSGLKWATCNVGATKPEEYGDYFAWGDTVPYYSSQDPLTWKEGKSAGYHWSTYKWRKGSYKTLTKYCSNSEYGNDGFTDSKTTLVLEDDAASYNWGGPWRMPTKGDIDELLATKDNTTDYTWTWCNGSTTKYAGTDVAGWQILRNSTGATLFLPAAGYRFETFLNNVGSYGYYWSSSLYTDNPHGAWGISFNSSSVSTSGSYYRSNGFSVRPVTQ